MPTSVQRHNLIFVILDGIAIGLIAAGGSFVSVFVVRLGASPFWVSLLSSIPSAIALIMTIPWSRFVERQPRPERVLAWARLSGYAMYLPVAILTFFIRNETAARIVVILWSLTALPGSLTNLVFTMTMGHAVPPQQRSFLMSRRWMIMGIAQSLALPLVSWLIDHLPFPLGYQIVFMANVVIAFWSFYCTRQIQVQRPPMAPPTHARLPFWTTIRQIVAQVLSARPFLIFIGGKSLYNLGLAMVSGLITIYWVKHLDFSDTWVGNMTTTATITTLISYLPWVRIKRKIGTWKLVIVSVLGCSLYPALLSLTTSPWAALPVVAWNGIVGAALNLAFFDALLDVCPPRLEERFVAFNSVAVHLTGIVGPTIGASLLSVLPIRWVLAVGSLVALTGVGVFALAGVGPKHADVSVSEGAGGS